MSGSVHHDPISTRRESHARASAELRLLSDSDLEALLAEGVRLGSGIGGIRSVIDVDGVAVFVKQISLTGSERQAGNIESTRDLFGMPLGCHYGVGSPGFGVWREVAANAMATELMLTSSLDCFAAMYHWRVLDGTPYAEPLSDELADVETLVSYWDNAPGVRRRVEAIGAATAHVALFLEYVPTTLPQWLQTQIAKGPDAANVAIDCVEQCFVRNVPAMNDAGLFHFDAHFDNMLVNGEQILLADFGLATSPNFELSELERDFLAHNASHDLAHTITRLVDWLVAEFVKPASLRERDEFIQNIASTNSVSLPMNASARRVIERYAPIAALINGFYARLHTEDRTAEYPSLAVREACEKARLRVPRIG